MANPMLARCVSFSDPATAPQRGKPVPLPTRRRWQETSLCTYRRKHRTFVCTLVTLHSAPDACPRREALRQLVLVNTPPVSLGRAA